MKIRLGKTKDSRTRKQPVKAVDIRAAEDLIKELKNQEEFIGYLLMKGFSTTSTKRYARDTETFLKWVEKQHIPVYEISHNDILFYIQSKKKTLQNKSISAHINSLRHYFNFLALTNEIIENPTIQIQIKGIKRKKLHPILSSQELESLFNNFVVYEDQSKFKNQNWFNESQLASKRNKVILGLLIYQGLGTTELGRLTIKDLKLREGKIFVAATRRSNERTLKLEAHQVIDMMEYIYQVREEILSLAEKQSESLFVTLGKSHEFRTISAKLIKKLRKQNKKVTSLNQIRTSVITHWLKNHNLREVQYMAGHRYVSSTEAFLVNDLEDLQEDINKFHPMG